MVDLAALQDSEVGDGTTSVVIIAAELLRRGNSLIQRSSQTNSSNGMHPTTILSGYRMALKESVSFIKKNLLTSVTSMEDQYLINAAKTSMSSKLIGMESNFFAKIAVDAVKSVQIKSFDGKKNKFPLSAIHVLKAHGKSSTESELIDGGFALNTTRASQGMPTNLTNCKVALLDMNLQRHRMGHGISINIKDPAEIEKIKQREMDITKERIQMILDTGANVVLTSKGIDDLCMKYFVEAGAICARRVPVNDLKRLAKAIGGKLVVTMADASYDETDDDDNVNDNEGNETFDPSCLGECDAVREERVGDGEMMYFMGCKGHGASTIVLRGANEYMLDEMDRALHDSLCVVKRILESNSLVAGGGAVEAALNVHLHEFATSIPTREQLAVQEFADALLVIPKTLAINAAKDASDLIAILRSKSQENSNMGLDLINGVVRDNLSAGVIEPAISKIKSLRFATEAAITILRIDDRIILQDPQAPA